jgi:hypothetical protein
MGSRCERDRRFGTLRAATLRDPETPVLSGTIHAERDKYNGELGRRSAY